MSCKHQGLSPHANQNQIKKQIIAILSFHSLPFSPNHFTFNAHHLFFNMLSNFPKEDATK